MKVLQLFSFSSLLWIFWGLCFSPSTIFKKIYLFLAALSPRCCTRALPCHCELGATPCHGAQAPHRGGPSSCGTRAPSSGIVAHGHSSRGSRFPEGRPSGPAACGILPDQGPNPRPLHWQVDSQPLRQQGSSTIFKVEIFSLLWIRPKASFLIDL